jgi:hypothetical protein
MSHQWPPDTAATAAPDVTNIRRIKIVTLFIFFFTQYYGSVSNSQPA